MKNLLVLNGQYYVGKDTEKNNLIFDCDRKNAKIIESEECLYDVLETIFGWILFEGFKLRRIEVLEVKEDTKCPNK